MNHGMTDQGMKWREPHQEALATLVAAFAQNQGFFLVRVPNILVRLHCLVRCCCRHLRNGDAALAQPIVQEELLRLFGVHVVPPRHRQLSLLAGLIRHVLVGYVRTRRQPETRGGAQLLVNELRWRLSAAAQTPPIDMLAVDAALNELCMRDPASGCLLELRYFARLALRYLALEVDAPVVEVQRNLRFAKAWLIHYLQNPHVTPC